MRLVVLPPVTLFVRHTFIVREDVGGAAKILVTRYRYAVYNVRSNTLPDDAAAKDVIAFDWHPDGSSSVTTPHVHVHSEGTRLSRKHHIPTGPVPFAAVVRFLIAELGVAPVRDDWQTVLTEDTGSRGYMHTPPEGLPPKAKQNAQQRRDEVSAAVSERVYRIIPEHRGDYDGWRGPHADFEPGLYLVLGGVIPVPRTLLDGQDDDTKLVRLFALFDDLMLHPDEYVQDAVHIQIGEWLHGDPKDLSGNLIDWSSLVVEDRRAGGGDDGTHETVDSQ